MKKEKIRYIIKQCGGIFCFEYNGKEGGVDPYYMPDTKSCEYSLFYDGEEMTVYNIDDVMSTPFIGGSAINDIAESLNVTEYCVY